MEVLDRKSWVVFFIPYGLLVFLIWLFLSFMSVPFVFLMGAFSSLLWLILGLVLGELLAIVLAKKMAVSYKYELADRNLIIRFGVLSRREVIIPRDRIQNVSVDQGLIARFIGLAQLRVQTAGENSAAILPGLAYAQAQKLCDDLSLKTI